MGIEKVSIGKLYSKFYYITLVKSIFYHTVGFLLHTIAQKNKNTVLKMTFDASIIEYIDRTDVRT